MSWWSERPIRFIQTNLREIDLPLDPQEYAALMSEYCADAVLFNLGGIVANYPTRLPFHYANPRIKKDFIPELLDALHSRGIRMVARFDFSKVNEAIGSLHPEWLYRGLAGETVTYNGQMHCCVNGLYQQECSLEILREALSSYPVDGVFFNMIGYQTTDYSGVYHGVCQCENCWRRFGEDLPRKEDHTDEKFRRYLRFCQETSKELFHRIRNTIRSVRPECAINTYTHEGVDMIRSESNSGIGRQQPEFVYESSLNVRRVYGSWPGLVSSNAVVHFIDFPYRHAGVSPALTARRLAQNMIHGGWVDFYVIGRLDRQPDRACLDEVKRLYHLSSQADSWLAGAERLADACVVAVDHSSPGFNPDELKGLVTLLSEEHVLYDVIEEAALERADLAEYLGKYKLVILGDMPHIPSSLAAALDRYVDRGGLLLLTGTCGSLRADATPVEKPVLRCAGIAELELRGQARGSYFAASSEDVCLLADLAGVDWLPMDTAWASCKPAKEADAMLKYVPVGMYGPPEKCYYTQMGIEPGVIANRYGRGMCVSVLWQIGTQHNRFPTHAIERLFHALINRVFELPRSIIFDAPRLVEVSAFRHADGRSIVVGLVNLSGQNGRATHHSLPILDIGMAVSEFGRAVNASSLISGPMESVPNQVRLARLELCDMVKIDFDQA